MEFEKMLRSLEPEGIGAAAEELLERLGLAPAADGSAKARGVAQSGYAVQKAKVTEGQTEPAQVKRDGESEESHQEGKGAEKGKDGEPEADKREEPAEHYVNEEAGSDEGSNWLQREIERSDEMEALRRESMKRSAQREKVYVQTMPEERRLPIVRELMPQLQSPGAKEISDYFRRDSRRYDRGFKRY